MSFKEKTHKLQQGRIPPQEFDPLPTQRVPLCTILRYPVLVIDPKKFLKAPIYTNFEGGSRAKKTRFFGQHFPKKAFFGLFFFQNFDGGAENLAKKEQNSALGARKINLVDEIF